MPSFAATVRACSGFASTTPTSSTSGRPARMRAWCCPRCPTPITAIRKRVMLRPQSQSSRVNVEADSRTSGSGRLLTTLRLANSDFRLTNVASRRASLHVQRVPGAVRDHVPGEVEPAQGEVADQVEHLVPGRFVREPHARCRSARADRTRASPHRSGACPTPCARSACASRFREECSAARDIACEVSGVMVSVCVCGGIGDSRP